MQVLDRPIHACHVENCTEEPKYVIVFNPPIRDQAYVCQTHALTLKFNPHIKEIKEL